MTMIESTPRIKEPTEQSIPKKYTDYQKRQVGQDHGTAPQMRGHQERIIRYAENAYADGEYHTLRKMSDEAIQLANQGYDVSDNEAPLDIFDVDPRDKAREKEEYKRYLKMTPAQRTAIANKILREAPEAGYEPDPSDVEDEADEETPYQDFFPSEAELELDSKRTIDKNYSRLVQLDPDYDEENEFGDKPFGRSMRISNKPPYYDKKEQE